MGESTIDARAGLVGLVGERAEPINLPAASEHPRFHPMPELGEEPFNAFLGVPIIHHRRVLGVLVAQQREQRRFDADEEAFLVTLAAQLATIIAHAEAVGGIEALVDADYATRNSEFMAWPVRRASRSALRRRCSRPPVWMRCPTGKPTT